VTIPPRPSSQPKLDRWLHAKVPQAAAAPPATPDAAAFMRNAEAFLALYEEMQGALSGRFRLVRFVLSVYQRPPAEWREACSSLRQDHAGLAGAMLERLALKPEHVRSLLIALDRFEDAARAAAEVRSARAKLTPEAIAAVNFPKLQGRLYLLSTLDVTFRDDPVLNQVFPTIERERIRKATGPLPPPPGAAEVMHQKLQEGIGRLLKGR
jgi:hypothetical protein